MDKYVVRVELEVEKGSKEIADVVHDVKRCFEFLNAGKWLDEYSATIIFVQPDSQSSRDKWPIRQGTWFDN